VKKWFSRVRKAVSLKDLPAPLRKLIVAVIGLTILLIGVAMVVLPGPAFIVIPVGLGILATEFAWARRAVRRARVMIAKARGRESGKARAMANAAR
jgi:tellurite resistance protein TerC